MQHPQLYIWQTILTNISNNLNCCLLYVVESIGSSPGRKGFAMLVNKKNDLVGSIGGGIMEHKLVEYAKDKIKKKDFSIELKHQIHNKQVEKNRSGMICSGEQSIALILIKNEDEQTIYKIIESLQINASNTLQISSKGIEHIQNHKSFDYIFNTDLYNHWVYKEKIGYKNHLTIIGAGHCALPLCKLFSEMDFFIELIDDRENLNTFNQNNFVHHKKIIKNYSQTSDEVLEKNNHYVVVMTMGYRTDAEVVKALQHKQFKYIGVLGSKSKMEQLLTEMQIEINPSFLKSLYTPIGLNIKSQTTQEIAISIAAQIIQLKNEFPF